MKRVYIKELYITNFGRIKGLKVDLARGLTSIEHENGWGKTTFAAFIKAMFYGLMETARKKDAFGDRERYKPWQGGIFGGSLIFEVADEEGSGGERTYRVERTFADKKKNDTFSLFDEETNTRSSEYGEDIGDVLFGVNVDTFERSVFITLDAGKKPEKSDDIAARLSGIVQNDDMASYSKAIEIIEDGATAIKSVRGKGIIPSLERQVEEDEAALRAIEGDKKQLEIALKNVETLEAEKGALLREQSKIQKECAMLGYYAKKEQRLSLIAAKETAEGRQGELLRFFGGEVPNDGVMQKIEGALDEYNRQKVIAENKALKPSEKDEYTAMLSSFNGQVPDTGETARIHALSAGHDETLRNIAERKMNKAEAAEHDALLPKYCNVSMEEIDSQVAKAAAIQGQGEEILSLTEALTKAESSLNDKKVQNTHSGAAKVYGAAAIGTFIAGAAAIVLLGVSSIVWMACIAAALAFTILAIVKRPRPIDMKAEEEKVSQAKAALEKAKAEKEQAEKESDRFIARFIQNTPNRVSALASVKTEYARYSTLKKKGEDFDKWYRTVKSGEEEKEILSFTSRYGFFDISGATMFLGNMKEKLRQIQVYKDRIDSAALCSKRQEEERGVLAALLSNYAVNKDAALENQVKECRDNRKALQIAGDAVFKARATIEDFDKAHKDEMQEILNAVESTSPQSQLDLQNKEAGQQIGEKEKKIAQLKTEINALASNIDTQQEREDSIAECKSALAKNNARYDVLCKTKMFLASAHEALQRKYMDPMSIGFNKYTKMLGASLPLNITSALDITVTSDGATHPYKHLSDGYKDLVNVCARLSLSDALFSDALPPIIMDDPFVNLDDDKVKNAIEMVLSLAKERQVIYLVCHKSRAIAGQ